MHSVDSGVSNGHFDHQQMCTGGQRDASLMTETDSFSYGVSFSQYFLYWNSSVAAPVVLITMCTLNTFDWYRLAGGVRVFHVHGSC